MKVKILSSEEQLATGATQLVVITSDDLTQTTAATAQAITAMALPVGTVASVTGLKVVTPFENTADTANNSCTVIVGDAVDDDRFVTSNQVNKNGTVVAYSAGTSVRQAYTSAGSLIVTFGAPPSGKTLASINKGELHVFVRLVNLPAAS